MIFELEGTEGKQKNKPFSLKASNLNHLDNRFETEA